MSLSLLSGTAAAKDAAASKSKTKDRPIEAEVFRLELAALVDKNTPQPSAGRVGAVRIGPLSDFVGQEIDLLFILDANDGVLPRDSSPVTLVSEALEGAVTKVVRDGITVAAVNDLLAARDLAALAAIEAKRSVFITTAQETVDTPSTPSRVVLALERVGVKIESGFRPALEITGDRDELQKRITRESIREGFFLDPQRPLSDIVGAINTNKTITKLVTEETGGTPKRALAVTSIERFAQCPFRGYAHVILGARAAEEQRELPDAREEGNLGHNALAAAFLATRERWPIRPRDRNAIMEEGLRAADVALAAAAGHAPLRAIVRLRVRESVRALLERAIDDENWDFLHAEQAFGSRSRTKDAPWPAYEIAGELWLRGSIDRVDKAHLQNEVRVVDYKRSKSTVRSSSSALGETALQVPIYAVVAARHLNVSATGAYIPMQTRDLATETRARAITPEQRVTELAAGDPAPIEKRSLDLVRSARLGLFAPLPAKESECTYCDASGGCRKPRFAMAPSDEIEVD